MGRRRIYCPKCLIGGWPKESYSPEGFCPRCVEKAAAARPPAPSPPPQPEHPPRPTIEWPDPAKLQDLPEPVETTEQELGRCLGEAPGPDDDPDPVSMFDENREEKRARLRRYHADILAGRQIQFVARGERLTGFRAQQMQAPSPVTSGAA